jgi:transposase
MKLTTIGLDLAKNVFQVHGTDERGKAMLRKTLKRGEVAKFFANLPACLIGIEACASAHFWARKLIGLVLSKITEPKPLMPLHDGSNSAFRRVARAV